MLYATMNMDNISSEKWYLILLTISAIVPFLTIVQDTFPYTGVGISFALLSTLSFLFLKNKRIYEIALFACSLVLASFFVLRANPFLLFLNTIALFYSNAVMILFSEEQHTMSLVRLIFSPAIVFFNSLRIHTPRYTLDKQPTMSVKITKPDHVIISIIITLVTLLLVIPLLSSANPLFADLVKTISSHFNVEHLMKLLSGETMLTYLFRLIVFGILFLLLPRLATFIRTQTPAKHLSNERDTEHHTIFLLPKVAVSVVLLVFFVTQIQLYFSTEETLMAMGYTHSQYVNEVFAQLSFVALIIFALIYNDKNKSAASRYSTYLLIIQTYFLILMALKSDWDYSSTYGLTYKRLWGFTGVFWITGALTLFLENYLRNKKHLLFIKQASMLTVTTLTLVNMANFDRLIYDVAKPTVNDMIDHGYLTSLTPDAYSYANHYLQIKKDLERMPTDQINSMVFLYDTRQLLLNMERAQNHTRDIRAYNYAISRTKSESRQINIEEELAYIQQRIDESHEALQRPHTP